MSSNPVVFNAPTVQMSYSSIAGFILLMFWLNDPDTITEANPSGTPFASLDAQIAGIQKAADNGTLGGYGDFQRFAGNLPQLYNTPDIKAKIVAAAQAIGAMKAAVSASGLWSVCSSAGIAQAASISMLDQD